MYTQISDWRTSTIPVAPARGTAQTQNEVHYRLGTNSIVQFGQDMTGYLQNFAYRTKNLDMTVKLLHLHSTFRKTIAKYGERVSQESAERKRKRLFEDDWHDTECRQVLDNIRLILQEDCSDAQLDKMQLQELSQTYRKMKKAKAVC